MLSRPAGPQPETIREGHSVPCGCSHARDAAYSHVLVAALAVIVVLLLLFLAVGVAGVHVCGDEVAAMWDFGCQGWRWVATGGRR